MRCTIVYWQITWVDSNRNEIFWENQESDTRTQRRTEQSNANSRVKTKRSMSACANRGKSGREYFKWTNRHAMASQELVISHLRSTAQNFCMRTTVFVSISASRLPRWSLPCIVYELLITLEKEISCGRDSKPSRHEPWDNMKAEQHLLYESELRPQWAIIGQCALPVALISF